MIICRKELKQKVQIPSQSLIQPLKVSHHNISGKKKSVIQIVETVTTDGRKQMWR